MTQVAGLLARARALNAGKSFAEIVRLMDDSGNDAAASGDPELVFLHADALYRIGDREAALQRLRGSSAGFRRRGNDRLNRMRLNLVGALHYELGQLDAAEAAWQELLEAASAERDEEYIARVNTNVGILQTLRGRTAEALASYGRSAEAARRLGFRRGLAQAHQNLGISYRDLGFLPEADAHFLRAAEHARAAESEDVLARAEEERALLLLLAGDPELAEAWASRARDRFRRLDDRAGEGEALRVLGIVALGRGDDVTASTHLEAALGLARATGQALLEAELLEARAALREQTGRPGADADRAAAESIFARLGAAEWGRRERARLAVVANTHPR